MHRTVFFRTLKRRKLDKVKLEFRRIKCLFPAFPKGFLLENINIFSVVPDIGASLIPDDAAAGEMTRRMDGGVI